MLSSRGEVLEHRSSTIGRWLRERRIRVALWIAVLEGALIVFHQIPWPLAVIVAAAVILGYFSAARRFRSDAAREASWIAAASQALVALVPVLLIVVSTLALIAVAILAVIALFVLFGDRR